MSHTLRFDSFIENHNCPIKGIPIERLLFSELKFVINFMSENKDLDDRTFKGKAHYLFIDGKQSRDNYPHHIEIIEILMTMCKAL